jgi:hypothetical protein
MPPEAVDFRLQGRYLLWLAFPDHSTSRLFVDSVGDPQSSLRPPATPHIQRLRAMRMRGLGCSLFARHYWGNRDCFLFLRLLRWFSSPRWLLTAYEFSGGCTGMTPCRFPDSEIPGSVPVSGSPRLIAAVHVLRRLPAPRHPPCALRSLTVSLGRVPKSTQPGLRIGTPCGFGSSMILYCFLTAWMLRFSFQGTFPSLDGRDHSETSP